MNKSLNSRIINFSPDNPAMVTLQDKLEEQRSISLHKFKALSPSQILQKRTGAFSSALVHEIRNPLTNINLAADILGSGNLDEENRILLAVIKRGVERINNLLTDFLSSYENKEIHSEIYSTSASPEE
jgi:signal transduction histidine kinase